ncbi:MAG: helix-turn-helix domain-containing protein [Oscillibacter sp.]|nr:helix-turn-helix domain-containing protein [Oscillibacter sp.]
MRAIELITANGFPFNGTLGIKQHAHAFYQIFYTTEGRANYVYEGQSMDVEQGTFLFVHPDRVHGLPVNQPGSRVLDIKFNVRETQLARQLAALPPLVRCTPDMQALLALADEEARKKEAFYSNALSSLIESVLYLAMRNSCPQYSGAGVGVLNLLECDYSKLSECVRKTLLRIEGAIVLGPDKSVLNETAQAVGYSKSYMCRRFSEEMGMTVMQYITLLRMDKAKELLLNTDNSVSEIAELLYYNDLTRFCKTFKKYTGQSPTQYRSAPAEQHTSLRYSYRRFIDEP